MWNPVEIEPAPEHFSADSIPAPITVGAKFWNNDLRVVVITEVAKQSNPWPDSDSIQTWHQTNAGRFDTMSGSLRRIGRLARYAPVGYSSGYDAEDHPVGTSYGDIKHLSPADARVRAAERARNLTAIDALPDPAA